MTKIALTSPGHVQNTVLEPGQEKAVSATATRETSRRRLIALVVLALAVIAAARTVSTFRCHVPRFVIGLTKNVARRARTGKNCLKKRQSAVNKRSVLGGFSDEQEEANQTG